MNIRDSYIHGADGKGVVKRLFFATTADVTANSDLHVNDLVFLLADTLGTQVPLTIPTLNQNTSGYASSLLTVESTSANNHYLTFVDSNNTTAEAESFYTSGDIYFKPSTGVLTVKSVTVSNTFNYSGIGSDTTSNAARKIWFASSSDGTPVVSDNFKYNPSTKTLTVDKISGPTIVIGNTTLYLDGANNVLTPDTVISNTSTDNTIPSSKAVWDAILTGMQANDAMVFKGFLTGGTDATHTTYTPGADRGDTYKVQTAGYINGEYYQVNDTFICTTDGTVAADSNKTTAQMDAIKANWGVVEGNGDYLNINGGTMYGTLSWDGTTALPEVTTASSILVVDSNVTKQISLTNLLASLNLAPSISNGTANNTVKITVGGIDSSDYTVPYATDSTYLKLISSTTANYSDSAKGKSHTFSIYGLSGSAHTTTYGDGPSTGDGYFAVFNWNDSYVTQIAIDLDPTNKLAIRNWKNDSTGWREWVNILTGANSYVDSDGYGTINSVAITKVANADYASNSDKLDNLNSDEFIRKVTIDRATNINANDLTLKNTFYNSSGDMAGTSGSWTNMPVTKPDGPWWILNLNMADDSYRHQIGGFYNDKHLFIRKQTYSSNAHGSAWGDWLKIAYVSEDKLLLFDDNKTLHVDQWSDITSVNTLDAGAYAIYIKSGTVHASGIFTACHGTDSVTDEIPLHVANSSTNTWRPYARISNNKLQMTTSETGSGTSRKYTINIVKLI